MRLIRNPQLWLSLGKEIWDRNRGHNLKQIAASLAFTTTLSLVPMDIGDHTHWLFTKRGSD